MKRYKQANEGIHAPGELKKSAAEQRPRTAKARWLGAVAAVLAVAVVAGVIFWPGGSPITPTGFAVAEAQYPQLAQRPSGDDFFSDNFDWEAYSAQEEAWWADRAALRVQCDFSPLSGFLSASTAEFLSGGGEANRVYSPLNLYMALAMLAETTGGQTRQQLLDLTGTDSIDQLRTLANALWRDHYNDDGQNTCTLANSLWLNEDVTFHQPVLDTLAADYYASTYQGRMGDPALDRALRDWLNTQTGGLLAEQVNGAALDPTTVIALASTVYFSARWSGEFYEGNTAPQTFYSPGGELTCDFMNSTRDMAYFWGEHYGAVRLFFEGAGYMWLILPDEGYTVDDLLQSGEAMDFILSDKDGHYNEETDGWDYSWTDQRTMEVRLAVPKFDVSSDLDLRAGLQSLGVTDVFDPAASDFTPLTALDELAVGQVQHAARVTIDEEGCKAAAFTLIPSAGAMPPQEYDHIDFILDRPFLFAIVSGYDLPLFVGVVNQP